jgi:hypothetical protein
MFFVVILSSFNSISESSLNILYSIYGLIVVAVFCRRILRLIIFHTPSIIWLPFYLKFLAIFVSLLGG